MYIRTDDNKNIVEIIAVGVKPTVNGYEIDDNIDREILENIFEYKYIDGQFIKNDNYRSSKIDQIKAVKISRMSEICNMIITNGIDYNGEHYSLSENDQINLMKLESIATIDPNATLMYHSDGNICRIFSTDEIKAIASLATRWVLYNTTYFNFVKSQIQLMTDVDAIIDINFGDRLIDSRLQEQLDAIVSTFGDGFSTITVEDGFDYSTIFPSINYDSLLHDAEQSKRITVDNNEPTTDTDSDTVDPEVPDINESTDEPTTDEGIDDTTGETDQTDDGNDDTTSSEIPVVDEGTTTEPGDDEVSSDEEVIEPSEPVEDPSVTDDNEGVDENATI